ncbi:hypothetical protein Tco_1165400 [Tanacetum coccineum]
MDGRGTGSCTMLGSLPSGLSFSISPSVRLSDVGRGEAGKGGYWVITPNLVVMAKVGASDSGVSVQLLTVLGHPLFIYYVCCFLMMGYRRSDKTSKGKDHYRCLPRTSIPAQPGWSACIHQPHGILRSSSRLGCIDSEMEEMFMGGNISSYRSSWYWTYSSIRFHTSSSVRELKRN